MEKESQNRLSGFISVVISCWKIQYVTSWKKRATTFSRCLLGQQQHESYWNNYCYIYSHYIKCLLHKIEHISGTINWNKSHDFLGLCLRRKPYTRLLLIAKLKTITLAYLDTHRLGHLSTLTEGKTGFLQYLIVNIECSDLYFISLSQLPHKSHCGIRCRMVIKARRRRFCKKQHYWKEYCSCTCEFTVAGTNHTQKEHHKTKPAQVHNRKKRDIRVPGS